MSQFKPYGNNILIVPKTKNKIIGDTSTKYLYGTVVDVGADVTDIPIGSIVAYTQWGTNKVVMEDGTELFFIQNNPDFLLAVMKDD